MGQFLEELPQYLIEWILKQQMFWVASAPLSPDGHVNISPKAIEGTFHVANPRRVWYEDLSGSGAETVSHIRENGRVTILFHAFEGPARIVRLYGKGFFYELGTPEYDALMPPGKRIPGTRAIIGLDVYKVGTTCGYAVPYYQFVGHRSQLIDWAEKREAIDEQDAVAPPSPPSSEFKIPLAPIAIDNRPKANPNGMIHWWQSRNLTSLDGLPAFSAALGIGFPFTVPFKHAANSRVYSAIHSKSIPTFIRGTDIFSEASSSIHSEESNVKCPILHNSILNFGRNQDQFKDIASFMLPYLLILICGFLLGTIYERSHCSYLGSGSLYSHIIHL